MKKVSEKLLLPGGRGIKMLGCALLTSLSASMFSQTFTESMGNVAGTTPISTYEAANGFDNDPFTMTGTADVRNTAPSSGYAGSSAGANIFFTNISGRFFQIEGINTNNLTNIGLSFGVLKSTTASNGSDFIIQVSSDGVNYATLSYPALPTGGGTAIWHLRTVSGAIPSTSNLRIRWVNTGTATQYRLDDVKLTGTACSTSITANGSTVLCSGGGVILTAGAGNAYLWSNGSTAQSINVSTSATFTVQVTDGNGCTAVSGPVRVLAYPAANVAAQANPNSICEGHTTTLTARTLAQDLIFSEYIEGSGNEKYIEIFNGTGNSVNLSDYRYQAFHNGATVPNFDVQLNGTLADGAVLVLKNPSASGYAGSAQSVFGVQHNGNDALALFKISTSSFVDIFGVIGQDPGPGTSWQGTGGYTTQDRTLRRKSIVYSGITTNPALPGIGGFSTLNSEWDLYPLNDVTGLGSHTMDGNYSWSPATSPATGKIVTASPANTSNYNLTGTFINGCSASGTVVVNVNPLPTILTSASPETIYLCYGPLCSTLSANVSGGTAPYAYNWNSGQTTSTAQVCPTVSSGYTATVTDANGCSAAAQVNVNVIDACCGNKNNVKVMVCHNGHPICISPNAVPAMLAQGDQVGPCNNNARMISSASNPADMQNSTLNAYPNPFNRSVKIEFNSPGSKDAVIRIRDINGKIVETINTRDNSVNWSAEAAGVKPGIYLCEISSDNNVQQIKLVITE